MNRGVYEVEFSKCFAQVLLPEVWTQLIPADEVLASFSGVWGINFCCFHTESTTDLSSMLPIFKEGLKAVFWDIWGKLG